MNNTTTEAQSTAYQLTRTLQRIIFAVHGDRDMMPNGAASRLISAVGDAAALIEALLDADEREDFRGHTIRENAPAIFGAIGQALANPSAKVRAEGKHAAHVLGLFVQFWS